MAATKDNFVEILGSDLGIADAHKLSPEQLRDAIAGALAAERAKGKATSNGKKQGTLAVSKQGHAVCNGMSLRFAKDDTPYLYELMTGESLTEPESQLGGILFDFLRMNDEQLKTRKQLSEERTEQIETAQAEKLGIKNAEDMSSDDRKAAIKAAKEKKAKAAARKRSKR